MKTKITPEHYFLFLFISAFLLMIPLTNSYRHVGGNNRDYMLGSGVFTLEVNVTTATKSLAEAGILYPSVVDLDNDGVNEIIIVDGGTIKIYSSHLLTLEGEFDTSYYPEASSDCYGCVITANTSYDLMDIDNDNLTEIIYFSDKGAWGEGGGHFEKIDFNGSDFTRTNVSNSVLWVDDTSPRFSAEVIQSIVSCDETTKRCLGCGIDEDYWGYRLQCFGFNNTHYYDHAVFYHLENYDGACFPQVRTIPVADIDNDGKNEFVLAYLYVGQGEASEKLELLVLRIKDDLNMEVVCTNTVTLGNIKSDTKINCNDYRQFIGSPIVMDIDGIESNGLEIVVSVMTDSTGFKMYSFESDCDVEDDYPELANIDASYVSNVMRADIFDDTGDNDFCALGYGYDDNIRLLCASEESASFLGLGESEKFTYSATGYENLSTRYDLWNNLIHSGTHDASLNQYGHNPDELISSWGVFFINHGDNDLVKKYENPYHPATVIASDVEVTGFEDLILLTSTNLWYLDDSYSNTGCGNQNCIAEIYYNPSILQTWQVNTSVEIRLTISDIDNNDIAGRVVLYSGDSNEQDSGWSSNVTSGTTIPFSFTANKTITSGIIKLYARDTFNPSSEEILERYFSVAETGIVFGESTYTETLEVAPPIDEFIETETDLQENAIAVFLGEFSQYTKIGESILYFIIMAIITVAIWMYAGENQHNTALGVIGIFNVLMIFIGVKLGIIGFVYIVLVVLVLITVATISLRSIFMGGNSGV